MTLNLTILGKAYRIHCEAPEFEQRLRILTSGFQTNESSEPNVTIRIGDDLSMSGLGEPDRYPNTEDLAVAFEHALLHDALQCERCIPIHAGVLTIAGRTTLLVGRSGAGKTTVALALALGGHTFLSDEAVPIDVDTDCVQPFARCPAASDETVALLELDLASTPHTRIGDTTCISPESFGPIDTHPREVDDCVFMSRGDTSSITRMSQAEGLARLMGSASGMENRGAAFKSLSRIANRARFFRLINGRLEDTIEMIVNLE